MTPSKHGMSDFDLGEKFGTIEAKLEAGNRRFEALAGEVKSVDKKVDDVDDKVVNVSSEISKFKTEMWKAIALATAVSTLGSAGLAKFLGAL